MPRSSNLLRDAFSLTKKIAKARFWPLFVIFAIGCTIVLVAEQGVRDTRPDQEWTRIILLGANALWDLLESVLLMLIMSHGVVKVQPLQGAAFNLKPFRKGYLTDFLAEYLRMIGHILFWSIFLILPGIVRYIQLIYVPFITLFAQAYVEDEINPLKLSWQLVRQTLIPTALTLVISGLLAMAMEIIPLADQAFHSVFIRAGFYLLSFLISMVTYSVIFLLFKRAMEAKKWT